MGFSATQGNERVTGGASGGRNNISTVLVVVGLCVFAVPFMIATALPPANHDVAAILHFAERWLGGERIYVDLVDMNPPLIFILSTVPIVVARVVDIQITTAAIICVYVLALWSVIACWKIIASDTNGSPVRNALLLPLMLFVVAPLAGHSFGQREHLMLLAALPYILFAEARLSSRPVRKNLGIAVTVVSTLGFCLKPYFIFVPALIEVFLVFRIGLRTSLRHGWLLLSLAIAIGYAGLVVVSFPAYLAHMVPLAALHYTPSLCCVSVADDLGHRAISTLISIPELARSEIVATLAAIFAFRRSSSNRARLVAMAMIGTFLAGVIQRKGWDYHFIPFEGFVATLSVILVGEWLEPYLTGAAGRMRALATLGILAIFVAGYSHVLNARNSFWNMTDYRGSPADRLVEVLRSNAEGRGVMVLSLGMYPFFPALTYARAKLVSSFMTMWVLRGAYRACLPDGRRYRDRSTMDHAEALVFDRVTKAFQEERPAVLVVDRRTSIPVCGVEFDFLSYFSRDPMFSNQFSRYKRIDTFGGFDVYARN